jgi:hypothetical protein
MLILVPFKPVAIVLGCLSALILGSYFVSCWMEHKSPFLTYHPMQIHETRPGRPFGSATQASVSIHATD